MRAARQLGNDGKSGGAALGKGRGQKGTDGVLLQQFHEASRRDSSAEKGPGSTGKGKDQGLWIIGNLLHGGY